MQNTPSGSNKYNSNVTITDHITRYRSFGEFYPFYLSQHQNMVCRNLHFVGSALILIVLVIILVSQQWGYLLTLPVIGYGFAWVGHFFFEHNRPATFTYPLYSFYGDWVMFYQMLTRKLK